MKAVLFRDHPAENWPSMDRYAESLFEGLQQVAAPNWRFGMPMPPALRSGAYGQLLNRAMLYLLWARQNQADVNHILDHSYGHLLFALDPARTIVTIHDVAPLRYPGRRLGITGMLWRYAWRGLQRARHIIVVSQFSADEVKTWLDSPDMHISVVHQAVAPHFHPQPPASNRSTRSQFTPEQGRLLLHVGSAQVRKNLPTLLEALALLRKQDIPAVLVQVGAQLTPTLQRLIIELDLQNAVYFQDKIAEDALVRLYAAADLFIFPSYYEGFGMPVLEAMACGTPVVAANTASLPEVVGDAGLLTEPTPVALADAIARVLTTSELRKELRSRGLERASQFTWQETARKTVAVYQAIASET